MREIKFRAWDKEINAFVDIHGFFKNASKHKDRLLRSSGEIIASAEASNFFYAANTCELMQYTGLKDKNGKEIYEGDIVELSELQTKMYKDTIMDGYKNFGVIFYGGNFVLRPWLDECLYNTFRDNTWCIGNIYPRDMEIIGNIYENPELLKESEEE